MNRKYTLIGIVLIMILYIGFLHWDTLFVQLQELYYRVYYSRDNKMAKSRIEVKTFTSKLLQNSVREVRIYIPEVYDSQQSARFPTVYLLHGYPGSNTDWLINTNLQEKLDTLIREGKIPPMIVIFPNGNGPIVRDSQYLNATSVNQPMESHIVTELIPYIDSHYRTENSREKRAIGGLSSGAYGAINLGLRNNELFGFVFSHSGYFINRESILPKLLGKNSQIIAENNPLRYMENKLINPKTHLYFDIGKQDSATFIRDNKAFDALLKQRNIPHTFTLTNGWHNWNVWANNISSSLQEYAQFLKRYN